MTEDDTFNRLKRIPFQEMLDLWNHCPLTSGSPGCDNFFKNHGWNWEDYMEEFNRMVGR